MRKKIIALFLILLIFQTIQITTVSYSIRNYQSAVNQVTVTVVGQEVSQSTSYLLNQLRDDVVLIAGMNFPVTRLKRFRASWEAFHQKIHSMYKLIKKLSFDPALLTQLKKNVAASAEKKQNFENMILLDSQDEEYIGRIRDAAFEFDESMEQTKAILDIFLVKFVEEKGLAVAHEQRIHNLPIQVVSGIGFIIVCILVFVGLFAVSKIVNPLIDLTEKYKIAMQKLKKEQEIALALEKARATAQAKSDFLANMSHELRTPMNSILGFSQMLKDSELNDKQKNYVDLVLSSGEHLIQIINDILDFSKLEAGKISLENIDVNFEKLINDVMKITTSRIVDYPLDTYVEYPDNLTKYIKSDPMRLKQILVNLLSNAIKFTPDGEIGVIVRFDEHIEHHEDEVPLRVSVKDSGIGISKDKVETIFDSFTQGDETTTRKFGGTGLGLTITRSIVEAMGGRIKVESEEGSGSEFIFSIKVKKGQAVDELTVDSSALKVLKGKRVFIIDDNKISLKVLKKTSESIGMEVLSLADSGAKALSQLRDFAKKNILPEVILCDIMMSEMYGYEFAQQLRKDKNYRNTKIVAVTSMPESDISYYIQDNCFDEYLRKPVTQFDMVNVLAKLLGYQKPEDKKAVDISDKGRFAGIKILVAENSFTNLMLLRECLEELQCDVDYTHNGKEAISRLETREYDLCLMDLQMPILGGIEAAQFIRKNISESLPIIALTAAVLTADREKAQKAGMNDFIEKPIVIARLKEKILQYTKPVKSQGDATKKDIKKIKTLVVDDNKMNLKLLTAILKKLNCEFDTAFNGQEAVEKTKSNTYDICFMDIQMPVMSGDEASKIIRKDISKELPIIAVTAVKHFTKQNSLDAGMNECLYKPVEITKIKEVLEQYCQ